MKKLVLFLMFWVMPAFGQVYTSVAFQKMPGNWVQVIPFAQVTVCTSVATGNPCSPAATLFTDQTLTVSTGNNLITADSLGNYTFFAPQGIYLVCVSGGSNSRCDYVSTGGTNVGASSGAAVPVYAGPGTNLIPDGSIGDSSGLGDWFAKSLSTTGTGFTQTFQTQTAPSVPAAGNMVWYGDSGTNKWACLNHDGSSCAPGGAAFSGITAGANSNAGTYSASGNSWDFTAATIFRLRIGAGCTTTVQGDLCYDTTNKMWHIWQNGADNFMFTGVASGTYTNGDCVSLTKSGNIINLVDSGGACGGSSAGAPIYFGSNGANLSTSGTFFIGASAGPGGTEAPHQISVPRSGTVSGLTCRVGNALSSTQTFTFTVFKGLAGNGTVTGSSTTSTCVINSTNTNGCADNTHTFSVALDDILEIQVVAANTPPAGTGNCMVMLQ